MSLNAQAATYNLDKAHTSIGFKVKHLLSWTKGTFGQFDGSIELDEENLENSSFNATIQTASIDTENEKRDKHLRSADFFDA